ncbi:MAG: hypothetical protein ABI841_02015 [Chloroflexota bacterium]
MSDPTRACPACGFDPASPAPADRPPGPGILLGPTALALLALGTVAMLIAAFVAGVQLQSAADGDAVASPTSTQPTALSLPVRGRILFAERLEDALELESYKDQFTRDDTIAWRAEFVEPPRTGELTLVITWVSPRERMQLTETAVAVADSQLRVIGREEVPLADLVPTAGVYEVAYYDGDATLTVGVFELLPPAP